MGAGQVKRLRFYADASAFGGCEDPEFAEDSNALMDLVREGKATLVASDLLADELLAAPPEVKEVV